MNLDESGLREICGDLIGDLDEVLSLKWDGHFQALLAEFPVTRQPSVRAILEKHLALEFDRKTIRNAPDRLRESAGPFGDLRSNQVLFASARQEGLLVLAAWWPWADGERISIRIASPDPEAGASPRPGIWRRLIGLMID